MGCELEAALGEVLAQMRGDGPLRCRSVHKSRSKDIPRYGSAWNGEQPWVSIRDLLNVI